MIYIKEIKEFEKLIKNVTYGFFTDMQTDSDNLINEYNDEVNEILLSINYNNKDFNDIIESTAFVFEGLAKLLDKKQYIIKKFGKDIEDKYNNKMNILFEETAKEIGLLCAYKYNISKNDNLIIATRYSQMVRNARQNYSMFISDIIDNVNDTVLQSMKEVDNIVEKYVKLINDFCDFNYRFISPNDDDSFFITKNLKEVTNMINDLKDFDKKSCDFDNFNTLLNDNIRVSLNNKLFDYKEMEKFAKSKNYEYKWSNGSHRIYENKITKKIVVIPSHELGLGLSKKIQKQIVNNSF